MIKFENISEWNLREKNISIIINFPQYVSESIIKYKQQKKLIFPEFSAKLNRNVIQTKQINHLTRKASLLMI